LSIFGDSELSLRLGPYLLSVGSTLLLFLWMNRSFATRPWLAAAVAILAAATPIWAYYGNMLEPLGSGVLFSLLGSLYFVDRWLTTGKNLDQAMALGFLLFGFLWDWAGFTSAGLIGVARWWARRRIGWRPAALYLGFALSIGTLLILWIAMIGDASDTGTGNLFSAANHRMGWFGTLQGDGGQMITLHGLASAVAKNHIKTFYLLLSILGLISGVYLTVQCVRDRGNTRRILLLIPLTVGATYILLFPQGAFVHDYWQTYLAVGLPIPLCVILADRLRGPKQLRIDMLTLVIALTLAFFTRVEIVGWWPPTESPAEGLAAQGSELASRTAPEETLLTHDNGTMPPMLQYYADRKQFPGALSPEILVHLLAAGSTLEHRIGGLLIRKTDVAPFLPTLEALVRDHGWTGPFAIGPHQFWDARP